MKKHRIETRVRYEETDQMRVVYYSNYFVYFEMGRAEYMRHRGIPYSSLEEKGICLMVTEANCRYLSSVKYDDEIIIEAWIDKCKGVRVRFGYRIFEKVTDKEVAEGFTEHACTNCEGQPSRLPKWLAEKLTEELANTTYEV